MLREGQQVTFEQFLDERLRSLLKLAMVLCGSRPPAEDVVQEVLLRAHQQWSRIAAMDSPYGYVRAMVVNEHLSWRRRNARTVTVADVDTGSGPDHADTVAGRDDLLRRLETLPPQQRAAIALRYFDDLPDDAIAEALQCSRGTVRSHISRGLATLRVDLSTGPEDVR
ncbi:SigE family RNA polymerase sigma factor [Jatrophihabitans fulvus]